ncbi:MAG TPA: phosphotransferase [Verrucomicrobiae bacterium]|nr:phosphotransferase [Verrucomicrobiae bacterium]
MLSSIETDLIRRDPSVPGLAIVLDPDAFVAALHRAAPQADLRTAHLAYARYKPQAFCRATYQLDVAGAELDLDVRACRPDDLAQWLADGEAANVASPLGPGRIVLEDCAVLVTAFPNDLKLPALQPLADAAKRKRLLRELLPDFPNLWQGELRGLRYRPERRYVAELHAPDGTQALLKTYTRKAYSRGKGNAQAFASRGLLRIARLLGWSDHHRLLAFEWLPGKLLMDLCTAPEVDWDAVTGAGAALATLHAQDSADLSCWTREAEAKDLRSLAAELGFICPPLARRADGLARRLAEELSGAPAMGCALHGDFSANQVLVSDEDVAIIDLDWACHGDPADDLGNFIAQAERKSLRGELPSERVGLLKESLLKGYALGASGALPERIELYTAVEVFRRTRFPFRAREPDWPERTEALLERAGAVFNSLP